jgi:hypothetical protein
MSERVWVPYAPFQGGLTPSPIRRRFVVATPEKVEHAELRQLLKRLEQVSGSAASEIRMAADVLSEMEGEEEADMSRELADDLASTVSDTIAAVNRLLDGK